jgi:hypothetical protein
VLKRDDEDMAGIAGSAIHERHHKVVLIHDGAALGRLTGCDLTKTARKLALRRECEGGGEQAEQNNEAHWVLLDWPKAFEAVDAPVVVIRFGCLM